MAESAQDLGCAWREDTADASLPCGQAMDYLYESLAEQRRDQSIGRGVFLSTIHSAKGTEFDHVLAPGEGWRRKRGAAAQEEERRLFYVGMTRARKTLAVFKTPGTSNHHADLLDGQYVLHRAAGQGRGVSPAVLTRRFELLGMADMFLDLAAGQTESHPIHAAISRLQPGSVLQRRLRKAFVELIDSEGHRVAQLSRSSSAQWLDRMGCIETIRVLAVVQRYGPDVQSDYKEGCRCSRWEVPLVEVAVRESPTA